MSRKRRVLALYYSQTGRTKDALEHFLRPLCDTADVEVDMVRIEPVRPFPYPWPVLRVLGTFPEVVLEEPVPLNPLLFDESKEYDLVVLGCQVWFLSASLPILGFLRSPAARVLAERPVIPVLTFRRAWDQGMRCIEGHIERLGGRLVGRVVMRAQDKVTFPLLRLLRAGPSAEGGKEYGFDDGEMQRVSQLGQRLAQSFAANPSAPLAALQAETTVVVPHKRPREQMGLQERLIEDFEPFQKQRYLRFARFIRAISRPETAWRYFCTAALAPLFMPPVYWNIPLLIVRHWVRALVRGRARRTLPLA